MSTVSELSPAGVFKYFELLSSVPHGSGNTKAVSDICVSFAVEHGLKYYQDELNNVIIYKPASAGYESAPTVVIQGHLDMVCAKTPDNPIDMATTPITLIHDGEWLRADNTSLGGDDIAAVALALAVLDDDSLQHPAIEAVFTVDEETGMEGATALDASRISGRLMLNIDSEEEGVFTCGCCGGVRVNAHMSSRTARVDKSYAGYRLCVDGLLGGHSGAEIHLGRANSNKLMARVLSDVCTEMPVMIESFEGGTADNAITSRTDALVYIPRISEERFIEIIREYDRAFRAEYAVTDPNVRLSFTLESTHAKEAVDEVDSEDFIFVLNSTPFGVIAMDSNISGLVETSLNPGIVRLNREEAKISWSVRSSVPSRKSMMVRLLTSIVERAGGSVTTYGDYPGWEFKRDSRIRDICTEVFKAQTGTEPKIVTIHAGLECGLFSDKLPGLDCISFGPDLKDIHSPRERLNIASVERLWDFVKEVLAQIK